jgi:hypothetical protein
MARINPVVGEVNPSVYNAAKNANLSPQQQLAVEQLAYTVKKAKELRALKADDAKREFQALTEEAQANIKALYPTAKFTQEDPSLLQRSLGIAGRVLKLGGSPIIGTLQSAIAWGKTINTPYQARAQKQQGADYSKQLLTDAYNGTNSWRWDEVAKYEEKYGKALITLARGTAEKKSIGKSIGLYGNFDEAIAEAIQYAGDNPEKFQNLVDELSQDAQVSPGDRKSVV